MENRRTELTRIEQVLGLGRQEELSPAEVLSWLAQITIALLIVFIIANFLFTEKAKKAIKDAKDEARAAKDQLGVLGGKYNYIVGTEKGGIYKDLEQALIEVQKQKLILGLEKVVSAVRNSFGLTYFGAINKEGEREYLLSDILSQGKVVNERFERGCVLADQIFSNQNQMKQDLFRQVLLEEHMVLNQSSVEPSLVDNPEIVTSDNAQWLSKEINSQVKAIYSDCCMMQKTALAYLMVYYQEHMDVLMDADLNKQLDQVLEEASEKEKVNRISESGERLYQHLKSLFHKQNVPLLDGV